jgi:hypothetical protein
MVMTMKNGVFWDVMPCGSMRRLLVTASIVPSSLILDPDEGGAKFLQNIGSYKSHTA